MPSFTCASCGVTFTLSDKVLARFPGWTPRACNACRKGPPENGRLHGRIKGGKGRGIEENLTVAQVLQRYHDGPDTGVFTDGSATPNPGPGGWGAVYVRDGVIIAQDHGRDPDTTNNRMELSAIIAGFALVPEGTAATIYTDSRLCMDTLTKWAAGWKARGWRRKDGPVSNVDLVEAAYTTLTARPELSVKWIAAHDGARWNEYADALSTAYRRATL